MRHTPVLLNEVIESLQLTPGASVVDCTLGDGGHAEKILEKTAPQGKLLGLDVDPEALLRAKQYLYAFSPRVIFVRDNFTNLKQIATENDFYPAAILLDLGWSAQQFAGRGRGFSFQNPAEPLDMRYDVKQGITAADILNYRSQDELRKIFKYYGEERMAKKIAAAVVDRREKQALATVGELVEIILKVYRDKFKTDKEVPWIGGLHPATKVFQALRLEVNDELNKLKAVLPQAVEILAPGGRLAVISFHSLEDGIVKHFFKRSKGLEILTKKPLAPGAEEIRRNPRARSAKLRVVRKQT